MSEKVTDNGLNTLSSRAILLLVLGLGGANGLATVTGTADRYTATRAAAELGKRDLQITYIQREIDQLQIQVNNIDATHPPPELVKQVSEAHKRLREVERALDRMGIQN